MRYKIEVQDETGIWTDVRGPDGTVLVQMEKYAGGKRTRVIRIIEDED